MAEGSTRVSDFAIPLNWKGDVYDLGYYPTVAEAIFAHNLAIVCLCNQEYRSVQPSELVELAQSSVPGQDRLEAIFDQVMHQLAEHRVHKKR